MKLKYSLFTVLFILFSCGEVENGVDGENGMNILVKVEEEPIGSNCANGGKKVSFGYDTNSSGVLDATEVSTSTFICNGEDGNDGSDGDDGNDGADGSANVDVSIVQWTSDMTSFYEHNYPNNGDGLVYAVWLSEGLTQDVVDNGFVRVDFAESLEGPWYSLPYQIFLSSDNNVDGIYTSTYTYGEGAVRVDWDATFGNTESIWNQMNFYECYYKLTVISE